jgi:hypothetical protein
MDEFETVYEKKLVPILRQHDLVKSSKPDGAGVEAITGRRAQATAAGDIGLQL